MMNRTWTTAFRAALFSAVGIFAMGTIGSVQGFGQAAYTATQTVPQFTVFAGGSYIQPQPDYYKNNQKAYLFGADYNFSYHRFYVNPSVEVRALISPVDEEVGERVYSGGLKLSHTYRRRFSPYGDLLIGTGTIEYSPARYGAGTPSDNSVVYTYGGGVDVNIWHNLGLKADYQGSRWHTGANSTFHPRSLNLGVIYSFGLSRNR
jgi:opacity protein-like surface antigen